MQQPHIDHIVPLKEAHISGASKWENKAKNQFFNDLDNLIPVSRSANRSKGSKDPASWLPTNQAFHCAYVQKWVAIKKKYDLDYDAKEQDAINNKTSAHNKLKALGLTDAEIKAL